MGTLNLGERKPLLSGKDWVCSGLSIWMLSCLPAPLEGRSGMTQAWDFAGRGRTHFSDFVNMESVSWCQGYNQVFLRQWRQQTGMMGSYRASNGCIIIIKKQNKTLVSDQLNLGTKDSVQYRDSLEPCALRNTHPHPHCIPTKMFNLHL